VTTNSSSDDSNTGLIIGVAVGAVALIAIGVVIYRRNK
jgi:hypothetical protein